LRLYWIIVSLACALTAPLILVSNPIRTSLQNLLFDQFQRWSPRVDPPDPAVRVVEVDDESIQRLGQWPWPRERLAKLVDALSDAGAAAIGLDVLFSEKERGDSEDGDAALVRAIANRPVALGEFLPDAHTGSVGVAKAGFASAGDDPALFLPRVMGQMGPLPELSRSAAAVGFLNWLPDGDRVVRRVPLLLNVDGKFQPSLAMETLRVAQGASTYLIKSSNANGEFAFGAQTGINGIKNGDAIIPTDDGGELRVYFSQFDPRVVIPAWKALEKGADLSDVAGKIVFIGVSASLLSDIVATPLRVSAPGVETHAQIIEQILSGVRLARPDWAPGAEFFLSLAVSLALAASLPRISPLGCAVAGGGLMASLGYFSWNAFRSFGLLIDPILPALSSGGVYLTAMLTLYALKRQQENEIRSAFGRFVSPAVVARLAENPEHLTLGGLQRTLTLMFCDIRSFTTLSEGLNATELTKFLNDYLTPMTDAVLDSQGTVDKYMGDAIMAFWNAPLDDPAHAEHAARVALRMRAMLKDLNEGWRRAAEAAGKVFVEVKFGIGLNTGECCVGNLGSIRRFDYSAIGDEVNIASRLEGASKFFQVDIVASESTRREVQNFAWVEIDSVIFKNKTRPIAVYALVGDSAFAAQPAFKQLELANAEMLEAYRDRRFEEATRLADTASRLAPAFLQGLYEFHGKRFSQLASAAAAPNWRPVLALDEK
jgi:adenylate cyclase